MYLSVSVVTIGEKCPFGFCAGCEFDDIEIPENPEKTKLDYLRDCCNDSLDEAFWEEMNAEPEWEIISLIQETPCYPKLKDLPEEDFEEFVYSFVSKTLVTSEVTYELDGEDITAQINPPKGEWDSVIFSEITSSVMYQFRKMFS